MSNTEPLPAGELRPGAGELQPGTGELRPGAGELRPQIEDALRTVFDPEIPVNVMDLRSEEHTSELQSL